MGWSAADYDGLSVEQLGVIAAELCRAINERLACFSLSLRSFPYDDAGTTANYPSAADFAGMQINGPGMTALIAEILSGLAVLMNTSGKVETLVFTNGFFDGGVWWRTTQSGETVYSRASLLSSLGLAAWPTAPTTALDARFWNAVRDILNSLLYPKVVNAVFSHEYQLREGAYTPGGTPWGVSDYEAAWDAARAASPSTSAGSLSVGWSVSAGVGQTEAEIREDLEATFDYSTLAGTVVKTKVWFEASGDTNGDPVNALFSLHGSSQAVSTDDDGTVYVRDLGSGWPALAADQVITLDISTSAPSDNPFADGCVGLGCGPGYLSVELKVLGLSPMTLLDISGELTDQA